MEQIIQTPAAENISATRLLVPILSVLVCISLASTAFLVYQNWQLRKQLTEPTNYEECIKTPGISLQAIYPSVCTTYTGKSFTQLLTDEEKQNLLPPNKDDEVLGIQINTCCSCPTKINKSTIGTNGWVLYERGENYSSLLPKECERADCAPCPPLEN